MSTRVLRCLVTGSRGGTVTLTKKSCSLSRLDRFFPQDVWTSAYSGTISYETYRDVSARFGGMNLVCNPDNQLWFGRWQQKFNGSLTVTREDVPVVNVVSNQWKRHELGLV